MSIDSFVGFDSADGSVSPEQAREYKKRMAKNKKQIAAAQKQEKKQKKKEDKLYLILLKFIRENKRSDVTLLVARCLEQNIPAVFVLAIIMLGNDDLQKEFDIHFELLGAPEGEEQEDEPETDLEVVEEEQEAPPASNALVVFGNNESFPLEMRIALDLWTKHIWNAASPIPEKMFKTAIEFNEDKEADPEPKPVVNQLTAFILRNYFEDKYFDEEFDKVKAFAEFFMGGLFKRLKEQAKDQMQLGGEEY
jgi:hypothetical protein